MRVTRETDDESLDHEVTVMYERDGYGWRVSLDAASYDLVGELTQREIDRAVDLIEQEIYDE